MEKPQTFPRLAKAVRSFSTLALRFGRNDRLLLAPANEEDDLALHGFSGVVREEFRAGLAPGGSPAPIPEFAIPAYGSVAAAASSPHLRLVDLTRPLAAGDTVILILQTAGGDTLRVSAPVRKP